MIVENNSNLLKMESTKLTLHSEEAKPFKLSKWKVHIGSHLIKGSSLLLGNYSMKSSVSVKATHFGRVEKLIAKTDDVINKGDAILILNTSCSHEMNYHGLCAICGKILKDENMDQKQNLMSMISNVPPIQVKENVTESICREIQTPLLELQKLILLVDIDKTILHTTINWVSEHLKDVFRYQINGPRSSWYTTKLRPGAIEFLEKMSKFFELHIFTLGSRKYARQIAKHIDPEKKYFSDRIYSKDECYDSHSKLVNLKRLFPSGDSIVCIIDARKDVWDYSQNNIPVKPYVYFDKTGDINDPNFINLTCKRNRSMDAIKDIGESNPKKAKLADGNQKVEQTISKTFESENNGKIDEDDHLLYVEDKLMTIHKTFFEKFPRSRCNPFLPDVKYIISYIRGRVLEGVIIAFSGVFTRNSESSKLCNLAISMGAKIELEITDEITHLIATNCQTKKVYEAKKKNIHIVHPAWIFTCDERWEKVDERLFAIEKNSLVMPLNSRELVQKNVDHDNTISTDDYHCNLGIDEEELIRPIFGSANC